MIETCGNCGSPIGKLEPAMVWKNNVVCAACHKKLNDNPLDDLAKVQTHRMAYATPVPKRPRLPRLLNRLAIVVGVIVALFAWMVISGNQTAHPTPASRSVVSRSDPAKRREIETMLNGMVQQGLIHSIEWDRKRMRVDPRTWDSLKIETKRNLAGMLCNYYIYSGDKLVGVKVVSARNDVELFAEANEFSGAKIHR